MASKTYQHLFFDLDHTLWDFDKNSETVWRHLYQTHRLAEQGIPDFESFISSYLLHNHKLWDRYRKGFITRQDLRWKRVWLTFQDFKVRNLKLAETLGDAYLELLPRQLHLVPDALEVLKYCQEKSYQVHLISNGFEETQRGKMKNTGLLSFFSQIITSESSMCVKPNRDIFDFALTATAAQSHQCLMIGDALDVDICGARNAGWDQVYYNPAKLHHSEKVTYEISTLKELTAIL